MKCIAAAWMVTFHSGYELDEDDYRAVSALCRRLAWRSRLNTNALLETVFSDTLQEGFGIILVTVQYSVDT